MQTSLVLLSNIESKSHIHTLVSLEFTRCFMLITANGHLIVFKSTYFWLLLFILDDVIAGNVDEIRITLVRFRWKNIA